MIDKKINLDCTGCSACFSACPKKAVSLVTNSEGFWYPVVNYELCIGCKVCLKKCPVLEKQNTYYDEPIVYASWNLDDDIRVSSTSGGVFSAIAQAFLEQNGIVFGAAYDEKFNIYHRKIVSKDEISLLRQSKYAQSDMRNIFQQVKEELKQGKKVLFCGTPCQSAGLQSYLGKEWENLFCCDFICRGVISPKVYRKFLNDLAKKYKTNVSSIQFKNKDFGWNRFSTKIMFMDGSSYQQDRDTDCYMRGYLKHNLYLRPSCHDCKFKTIPRQSDISLGDFWGIGKSDEKLDNDKGTSVVLVNSKKGAQLLEWSASQLFIQKHQINEVLRGNTCLLNSAQEGKYRAYFFKHLDQVPFDKLVKRIDKKSLNLNLKDYVLRTLSRIRRRIFRREYE